LGIIFFFAFLLAISCSVLLELIQQLENGKRLSIFQALKDSFKQNIRKMLPLILAWTVIWFILIVIDSFLSRKESNEEKELSAKNAAKTLAGSQKFSFSRSTLRGLEKAVRMTIFLILPGIAWHNLGFKQSVKKGITVLKSNIAEFASGFVLTGLATAIIYFPPTLAVYMDLQMEVEISDWLWLSVIIYIGFAWSYSIYLEQMFAAELYLWHHKYQKQVEKAKRENLPPPKLEDVKRPSLLDDTNDLLVL
jgi:hypothetical protein